MSTCSTATSTHRGNESCCRRRRPTSSEAVRGHLEMRLQDLKQDWDAYKTGRSGALRHRRSRSASSLPSSAVTVAAPDGFHLSHHPCSSGRLVLSLQLQTGSVDASTTTGPRDEDASSVWSVEGGYSVATYSSSCSCSCPSQCASFAAATPPLEVGGIDGGRARKMDERKWPATSRVVWISAIALVVAGFIAMVVELGVDEGCVEYQMPT